MRLWHYIYGNLVLQWARPCVLRVICVRSSPNLNRLAGEVCVEWRTWGQWFGITSIAGGSLLQSVAYIILAVSIISRMRC